MVPMARLLLVHAHPDDETLATGVTIAHHVAAGHEVHVLTCTLGDLGEVIPAELAHLADDPDRLARYRRAELAEAMARLGARHTVLGEGRDGRARWRDSGMAGTAGAEHDRAFVRADLQESAAAVADVLRRVRPDVVVTYDAGGGYGHPDHIQTRRVTLSAIRGLGREERPARVFEIVTPLSWARGDRQRLAQLPVAPGLQVPGPEDPYAVSVVVDVALAQVATHVVVDQAALDRQARALEAHRTQVIVHPPVGSAGQPGYYALSNDVAHLLAGREAFVRIDPATEQRLPRVAAGWVDGLLGEDG